MNDILTRLAYVRSVLHSAHALTTATLVGLAYLGINAAIQSYIHDGILNFYRTLYPAFTIASSVIVIINAVLLGVAIALLIHVVRDVRHSGTGLGLGGIVFGSLAAGCPGCFFGIFPLDLSLLGVSATLAILPLHGLEFQALSTVLLLASCYQTSKPPTITCPLRKR